MKKYTVKQVTLFALVLIAGCKKDSKTTNVLSEEFASVYLLPDKDWKFVTNNSANITAEWTQGSSTPGKLGPSGFPAHSYKDSPDEYVFVNGYYPSSTAPANISSWLITPSMMLKNGDLIQFYSRSSNVPGRIDRLQLLLNETSDSYDVGNTPESVGGFTKMLLDVNSDQTPEAFPAAWTLSSATISGLSGTIRTRLAFRYVVSGTRASGIGVDALSVTSR